MDWRFFTFSLIGFFVLAMVLAQTSSLLFVWFGLGFVANQEAKKLKHCPCCGRPVNSRDYGKEVFDGAE